MIGSVELVGNRNRYYYSIINSIYDYENKKVFEVDYKITGLKLYDKTLICHGRHKINRLLICSKEDGDSGVLEEVQCLESRLFISDVMIKNESLFFGTICGKIFRDGIFIQKLQTFSIQTLKFTSISEVVTGNYDFIFLQYKKYSLHYGRVFNVQINDYGFISSGEDRKVVIVDHKGIWGIQELRNYVISCYIFKSYVATVNKNGWFKLYRDRKLIESHDYGAQCVQSVAFLENQVLIGLTNGQIVNIHIENEIIPLVSRDFVMRSLEKTIDFLISKDTNVTTTTSDILVPSSSNLNTKNFEVRGNSVFFHKNNILKKEYRVCKPVTVRRNLIGTKNGWLIEKNKAYKISNDPIIDIKKKKEVIKIYTKDKIFYLKRKDNNLSTRICGQIITGNMTTEIYESIFPDLFFRYLKKDHAFREITCVIKKDKFLICGTAENSLVVLKNDKIIDSTFVIGSPSSIISSGKSFFVGTLEGYLYEIKIINSKLFIRKEIRNNFKIASLAYKKNLYFVDSGGYLKKLKKDGTVMIVKNINKYVSKLLIRDNIFYGCTSEGSLMIYNEKVGSLIFNDVDKPAIHTISIWKNIILLGGDSHKIYRLIENSTSIVSHDSILAHSASIKDLVSGEKIYSISDDGFFKEWTDKLKFVRKFRIFLDLSNCFIIEGNFCYVFGSGIQKISLE